MTEIHIYGPISKLVGPYPKGLVKQVTSYPVEGAQFSKAYRKGRWDGRKHLFKPRSGTFPTGLVSVVKKVLEDNGNDVLVEDHREIPVPTKAGFDLNGVTFEYPYEYQLDACEKAVEQKQGILKIATNGGKTECACAITQYLGLQTLFIVSSRELMYQGQERFIKRLGLSEKEIGVVGDGKWEPGTFVTIAMLPTLESRMNSEECQSLLKSIQVLFVDECVSEYSIITTIDGYKYAKDVKVGDQVVSHAGYASVSRISYNKKPGIKIKTQFGVSLECSIDHPIAVLKNDENDDTFKVYWENANSIKPGDVVLERNLFGHVNPLNYKSYILGLFAGDGHWHTKNKVRWSYRKDFDFWEVTVHDCIKAAYPDAEINITENSRGDRTLTVQSVNFIKDLVDVGFSSQCNKTQTLPWIKDLNNYIGGLFDAEGHVERTGRLWLQTTSKGLMEVVHRYLRDVGIPATFVTCFKQHEKHSTAYRITIPASYAEDFYSKCIVLNTNKNKKGKGKRSQKNKIINTELWNLAAKNKSTPLLVEDVEFIEQLNTVELEVENDHTFTASGLLTHNCHHVGSETWFTISTLCPAYYRYGMSGTPLDRTDGANLRLIAATGDVIVNIDNKFLVERGISAQASIIWDKVTEPVLKKGIQYKTAYKQGVVENPQLLDKVVKWTDAFYQAGLGTLILCEEINHGHLIDNALWTNANSFIPHQFIFGEEETESRRSALSSFADGSLPVLIASSILDEGIDVPTIDALILAGSRKSRIRTMQRLGRGLRGKKLIVVEFANFCNKYLLKHSLQRLEDYQEEECFPIYYSEPDIDLIKSIWHEK